MVLGDHREAFRVEPPAGSIPSTSQNSQSGLVRSSGCEAMRAAISSSCASLPGAGQRRVAHVVLDVEVGVVDPQRPAAAGGRIASFWR